MSSNITTAKRKASAGSGLFVGEWHERVEAIVEAMREMSLQDDPLKMVQAYGARVRDWMPADRWMSLSRRGHKSPDFRITRSSMWSETIDPWKQKERLPLISGGFLADLIYGDEPRLINDISPLVSPDDPAWQYLEGMRSMLAVPHYDQGEGLNMVISMREKPGSFEPERFPEWVWVSGLFGRATHNLVLRNELKDAYDIVERELKVVADIQRSLLPQVLPKIPSLELSAYYRTSRWAGGDYYDFFPLPDGRWGILVADVSGHGTPAAVMMAITHSLAHSLPGPPDPPAACWAISTGSCRCTTRWPTRCSSPRSMAFTTRPHARSAIRAPGIIHPGSSAAATARFRRSRRLAGLRWAWTKISRMNRRPASYSPAT